MNPASSRHACGATVTVTAALPAAVLGIAVLPTTIVLLLTALLLTASPW